MLRFYGYFKEAVVESRLENSRTRRVILYYYLEDKSIMLVEPKQVNSGTPQGAFIKRHVILKSDGESSIRLILEAVAKVLGGKVVIEKSAKGESQSHGTVEEVGKISRGN